MKEFVLIFRTSANADFKPTTEQAQQMITGWMNWMSGIESSGKLANRGTRLGISNSKVVKANNVVTNGPFTEIKEFINGFIIVKADSIDEAVAIAKQCPMVAGGGGNVEVRPAVSPDDNS
ncbi:MAG: transcription initiation protein [Parafilimonas sp.]|nr:transcription initiation protein [Parafilimonas sp.]